MKYMLPAIGELGWLQYVSAYANWLIAQGHQVLVITSPQLFGMFQKEVVLKELPESWYIKSQDYQPNCFGLQGVHHLIIRKFFESWIETTEFKGYSLPPNFRLGWQDRNILKPFYLFKKLPVTAALGENRIIIFPRCRLAGAIGFPNLEKRNLSKDFWALLINTLLKYFSDYTITSIGVPSGAYTFEEIKHPKFEDFVSNTMTISKMLEYIEGSLATVGSTSANPKIALLQGVPSFIVGHERSRFVTEENWANTRVGFFDVGSLDNYTNFNTHKCIMEIIGFLHDCRTLQQ